MEKKMFSDWTYLEVSKWLSENGLLQDICEVFEAGIKIWVCVIRAYICAMIAHFILPSDVLCSILIKAPFSGASYAMR